jgi:hypothetical protein
VAVLQLRNHIPISGPANREPADGSESALRVSLGFEPAWFHRRCGVDFSERWHRDPRYRRGTLRVMKAELHRAFPAVAAWDPRRTDDLATLSGAYGAMLVPHLFGLPLRYAPDRWPVLPEEGRLSVEAIERLDVETVLAGPAVEELFAQMQDIAAEWGAVHGYLNWQGVLNNAFHLRGPDLFLDLHDRPAFVHRFLALVAEVMLRLAGEVQRRQRVSGFPIDQMSVSNCVMNLVSPMAYEQFVLPHDRRLAQGFARFGVHTCNWDVTPYIGALRRLPKLGYLDMGLASDLERVREAFPLARRAVLLSPVALQDAPLEEIRRDLARVRRELAPCDVVLADVQASTPDGRVRDVLEICVRLEAGLEAGEPEAGETPARGPRDGREEREP